MNKWPVIVVDLQNINFTSNFPTQNDIERELWNSIIKQAYAQFDYVLLIDLIDNICLEKHGAFSKENFERVYADFKLDSYENIEKQIDVLWDFIGKKVDPDIQEFYGIYSGNPPLKYIRTSLQLLTKILKGFFGKKVIVLVDGLDTPAQHYYKKISLSNPKDNAKFMKSISLYSEAITNILMSVGKGNADYTKKLLMVGISDSIVTTGTS
jgi:hypothetical protein